MGSYLIKCGATGHSLQEDTRIRLAFLHKPVMDLQNRSRARSAMQEGAGTETVAAGRSLDFENLLLSATVGDCGQVTLADSSLADALFLMKSLHGSQRGYVVENQSHRANSWTNHLNEEFKSLDELDQLDKAELSEQFSQLLNEMLQGNVFYIHRIQHVIVSLQVSYVDETVFEEVQRTPSSVYSYIKNSDGENIGHSLVNNFNEFMIFAAVSAYDQAQEQYKDLEKSGLLKPTESQDASSYSAVQIFDGFVGNGFGVLEDVSYFGLKNSSRKPYTPLSEKPELSVHIANYLKDNTARILLGYLANQGVDLSPSRKIGQDYQDQRGKRMRSLLKRVFMRQHNRLLTSEWERNEFQNEELLDFLERRIGEPELDLHSLTSPIPLDYADSSALSFFQNLFTQTRSA